MRSNKFENTSITCIRAVIAQWSNHLTADSQVTGSNPTIRRFFSYGALIDFSLVLLRDILGRINILLCHSSRRVLEYMYLTYQVHFLYILTYTMDLQSFLHDKRQALL
jgi:hypothetical protein